MRMRGDFSKKTQKTQKNYENKKKHKGKADIFIELIYKYNP